MEYWSDARFNLDFTVTPLLRGPFAGRLARGRPSHERSSPTLFRVVLV